MSPSQSNPLTANMNYSYTTKQASTNQAKLPLLIRPPLRSQPDPIPLLTHHHIANTMNSTTLTSISFQSPRFKLQPADPHHRLPPRHLEIKQKPVSSLKSPIHAAIGPNAAGGLNNANRRGAPLSDVIQDFYSSLNDKDSKRLHKLIAADCIMEDTAFYKPLDAKCTRTYLNRLMEAMGENVKFAVDEVCQGTESTIAVMWHLEWNGYVIPFTKGCSFCKCSGNEAALLIRKIHIFDESPLKPGKWALEILNIFTNLFDMFPKIAGGFLKNPEAVVQPFVKLYKFYLEPFILPLLAYYTHFWTYLAKGLTMKKKSQTIECIK